MRFFLPYSYAMITRNKTIFYKISFILVIVFPIFFASFWGATISLKDIIVFLLAFTCLYSIYEIGYIFNDTFTVEIEKTPTIRLNQKDIQFVNRSMNLLIAVRVLYIMIILVALNYMKIQNLNYFIIFLGLLNFAYAIHNQYRNRVNIFSIFFVVMFKYISVPVLFMPLNDYVVVAISLILVIPVIRTIEFAAKEKYKIHFLKNFVFDQFRVFYYLFLTLTFGIIYWYSGVFKTGFYLSIYFLTFRVFSYLILKTKSIGNKVKKIRKQETV